MPRTRCASTARSHSPIARSLIRRSARCSTQAANGGRRTRRAFCRAPVGAVHDERHGTSFVPCDDDRRLPSTGSVRVSQALKSSVVLSLLIVAALAEAAESDRAIVERQSQEFSDASAAGDGKALGALV